MKRIKAPIGEQPNRESGQAVVEYILLLIVVTLIALGVLTQFNQAFRAFASNYFGNYLACLLESGELPSMGEDTGASKTSSGGCNDQFKAFNIADGRPGKDSGSSSSSSGNAGKDGKSGASNGGSGGSHGSSDSSKIGGLNGSFGRTNGRPVTAIEAKDKKEEGAPGDAGVSGGSGRGRVANAPGAESKRTEVQLTGPGGDVEDKKDDQHAIKKVAETDESHLKKKKELVQPPRKPAAVEDDGEDGKGFTFSQFFRWLLIAAILLALVVFLGGQALSISKSSD